MLTSPTPRGAGGPVGASDSELGRLLARPVGHIRWGLERISRILEDLGDPHLAYDSLHVGGTNGKGSVCAIAATVGSAERTVGLYTSPHLSSFAERIRIDGSNADLDLLERCAARVRPLVEREGATYFEAASALAFLAFAEAGVELAAVEVGLGGRLDATNVLQPEGCAIVTVGLDHCEYLGHSIGEVAAEKAGILKPRVPVVLGDLPAKALHVVEAKASEIGSPLHRLGQTAHVADVRVHAGGTAFTYDSPALSEGIRLELPLPGQHQAHNAAVALLLLEKAGRLPAASFLPGLVGQVRWPGRVEVLESRGVDWILDVAHNPAGASALTATLGTLKPRRPIVVLTAMLARKAWPGILAVLREVADRLVLTIADSHPDGEGWDLAAVQAYLEGSEGRSGGGRVLPLEYHADLSTALSRASELAAGGTVVVAGSCYLVGDVRVALEARDGFEPGRPMD